MSSVGSILVVLFYLGVGALISSWLWGPLAWTPYDMALVVLWPFVLAFWLALGVIVLGGVFVLFLGVKEVVKR